MASKASIIGAGISLFAAVTPASAEGDPRRGADVYRACAACHSLEPGVHLTGPSLAGLIGRPVGKVAGFNRYSPDLREAEFEWEAGSLASFIENPPSMFPGTYMMFPGVRDAAAREDLVAFLTVATAPGGLEKAVEQGLITADAARGQAPPPLADPPSEGQVTAIRHCGDSFFITTADGVETPIWEKTSASRSTAPRPDRQPGYRSCSERA